MGKIVSQTLNLVRTPFRLLGGWVSKTFTRPATATPPEQAVLEEALTGWLDLLRREAARQGDSSALWQHVEKGFAKNLAELTREQFKNAYGAFQMCHTDEVDRTARAIYEDLEKNPTVLNTLRTGKLAIDVAAVIGTIAALAMTPLGGMAGGVLYFVLVPLAAAVTHQLVELLGQAYVDNQRDLARQRQQLLMAQYVSQPLSAWLAQWPATGGSEFERLQLALQRIPESIRQLDAAVRTALTPTKK